VPAKSEFPGLIRRQQGRVFYWSAHRLARDPQGFPDALIRLPLGATPAALSELCRRYEARLHDWLAGRSGDAWAFDGTVGSLCRIFERHPESPVHDVRPSTGRFYRECFKVIHATVGARSVQTVTAIDVKGWHRRWKEPAEEGGPERVKRAHAVVSALRMAIRFGAALELPRCRELSAALGELEFEKGARRTARMTADHVRAMIAAAPGLDAARGDRRYRYVAIATATQFETALRQKDVIGEWRRAPGQAPAWHGEYTWEAIQGGGILRLSTSKTGAAAQFDLTRYELLWPLLQGVPQGERAGAIIKGEGGLPIRETSHRKWFRELATAAGVPAHVWNMDARAGAVTEALESGVDIGVASRAATHSGIAMTARYDRETNTAIATVAEARRAARERRENKA
jgi:hypothetical protein